MANFVLSAFSNLARSLVGIDSVSRGSGANVLVGQDGSGNMGGGSSTGNDASAA
ncbi:hypothetical protein [Antarctobacter sp.]|uniref:hypothetical protein n=1 Tax=Antarctobacter sp. TaxID=1872577 RepID=UPI002B26F794|nr:hypothetical protein [Antarctobacter sp.]